MNLEDINLNVLIKEGSTNSNGHSDVLADLESHDYQSFKRRSPADDICMDETLDNNICTSIQAPDNSNVSSQAPNDFTVLNRSLCDSFSAPSQALEHNYNSPIPLPEHNCHTLSLKHGCSYTSTLKLDLMEPIMAVRESMLKLLKSVESTPQLPLIPDRERRPFRSVHRFNLRNYRSCSHLPRIDEVDEVGSVNKSLADYERRLRNFLFVRRVNEERKAWRDRILRNRRMDESEVADLPENLRLKQEENDDVCDENCKCQRCLIKQMQRRRLEFRRRHATWYMRRVFPHQARGLSLDMGNLSLEENRLGSPALRRIAALCAASDASDPVTLTCNSLSPGRECLVSSTSSSCKLSEGNSGSSDVSSTTLPNPFSVANLSTVSNGPQVNSLFSSNEFSQTDITRLRNMNISE